MISANEVVEKIRKQVPVEKIDFACILGSGLSSACPELEGKITLEYESLGMPSSNVKGHSGSFSFGKINGKNVVLATRYHFYESGNITNVRLPFEILSKLGCKCVILATASGGINPEFNVGDLVLIVDHINFSGVNPLVGMSEIKFVDLSQTYDFKLMDECRAIAKDRGINLKEGVHFQFGGPSYETAAEVRMAKLLGGDMASMSTAHDIILCGYFGMSVLAFASITNKAVGMSNEKLTHEDVLKKSLIAASKLKILLSDLIK